MSKFAKINVAKTFQNRPLAKINVAKNFQIEKKLDINFFRHVSSTMINQTLLLFAEFTRKIHNEERRMGDSDTS